MRSWGKKPTPGNVLRTATGSPIGQSPSPVKGGETGYYPAQWTQKEAVAIMRPKETITIKPKH